MGSDRIIRTVSAWQVIAQVVDALEDVTDGVEQRREVGMRLHALERRLEWLVRSMQEDIVKQREKRQCDHRSSASVLRRVS